MHLKNPLLFSLMAILLLGGTITPVLSQSETDPQIVINEIEINPEGSDAGLGVGGSGINSKSVEGKSGSQEYVELYNPTSQEIDISGWSLVPTAVWKKFTIPANTIILPDSFMIFTHVNYWFKDFGESVSLYDDSNNMIDETPIFKDQNDSGTTWQRITDGLDTDSITDWEFKRLTPKSSNGNLIEDQTSEFLFTAEIDKSIYNFGDKLVISGTISEKVDSEFIKIKVTGPNYFKNLAVFPDRDLNFTTTLNLQSVLGFEKGDYDVEIDYDVSTITTNFSIVDKIDISSTETETENLQMFTDKTSYLPGETVIFSAETNSSIEYGGLYYTVTDPNGKIIFDGTIFPTSTFSTVYQAGGGQIYPFSAQLFMSPVNPIFGTYEIEGVFKHQNSFSTNTYNELFGKTTFTLSKDAKEDVAISLTTDKELYTIGDVVKVSGRSNHVWTDTLNIDIQQTSLFHRTTTTSSDNRAAAANPITISDMVRLDGKGEFSFEFKVMDDISNPEDYFHALGSYKIRVSESFGSASVVIKFVDDPESYVDLRTPLGLETDVSEYVLGTAMKISGSIMNYDHKMSNNLRNFVEITISDPDGKLLSYIDHQGNSEATNCYTNDCDQFGKSLVYTAIPDSVGNYGIDLIIYPNQFDYGTYIINANHAESKTTESIQFEVISAQEEILAVDETKPPLTLELEKDIYYIGEKLNISGNVILKDPRSLDQSSTHPSGSTQFGSSYSTNFAQAEINYVQVSIPYPKFMKIVKSSNYQTIPDENEDYHGGGGSGGGGNYYEDADGNIVRGERIAQSDDDRRTGYDGQAILKKQKLLLTDMNFKAYPDENGDFNGLFDLRAGIFSSGTYLVKANYYGHYVEKTVSIVDNSLKGGLEPKIVFDFDKTEYVPGETVRISGNIENAYYYDTVSVIIETPDVSKINCLQGQQCGFGNTEKKLRVLESVNGPGFFMNYKIPYNENMIGKYDVTVDTHFGKIVKSFFVLSENEVIGKSISSPVISKKVIEKFNRIADNEIPIILTEKSSDDSTLSPRVIQGSLFTSARGEESDVNLRITTSNGQCVIGQSSDCLVTESTRKPGEIYSIVTIDDVNYKIRYSGNDVRLEKFSIVPENSTSKIDIDNWNVEILKDEQPSRFYYKVSYVALE